jgi:hypothetical protein
MKHGEISWYKFARPDKMGPILILTRRSVKTIGSLITTLPLARMADVGRAIRFALDL